MPPRNGVLRVLLLLGMLFQAISALPARSAATCEVVPRSWDEIASLVATPMPPEPERTGTLPWGEQVSAEELVAIRTTVEQFIACSNAGEPLRVYGLYTDAYLNRLLGRERPAINESRYHALATPVPASDGEGAELIEISGARDIVATGQLGALVTIAYPSVPDPKMFFFTFRSIGGMLLIDDILGELTFSLP